MTGIDDDLIRPVEKAVKESYVEMREMVLPNDTNLLGNLLGGRLLHLIDLAGAMVASRHSNKIVATVSIDNVDFKVPIKLGELVILKAALIWVGRTSMEVLVKIYSENTITGTIVNTNKAYLSYVAVDDNQKPSPVPRLRIDSESAQKLYDEAEIRRKRRLEKNDRNIQKH
jgi:acyl-CoA hydrolase